MRDWLYVEDTAKAIVDIIKKGEDEQIYNICANMFASVKEIVEKIVILMGKDSRKDVVFKKRRPGDDVLYAMKCEKIKRLGWSPSTDLNRGLEKTVKWYVDNTWWWKSIIDENYVLADTPW